MPLTGSTVASRNPPLVPNVEDVTSVEPFGFSTTIRTAQQLASTAMLTVCPAVPAKVSAPFCPGTVVVTVAGLPPATMTCLRSLIGTALMGAWLLARREPPWPFERRETGRLALLGILGVAVPLLVGTEGIERSTSTNASILILLEIPAIVLFARLLLGERMGARQAGGLALGLSGALAVVTEGATAGPTLLRGEHLLGNVAEDILEDAEGAREFEARLDRAAPECSGDALTFRRGVRLRAL